MIIEKTSLLAGAFQHGDRCRRRQDRLHRAGISWGNGYCERFNGKLRGEWLNGGIFYTLKEAPIVIENWPSTTTRCVDIHCWNIDHRRRSTRLPCTKGVSRNAIAKLTLTLVRPLVASIEFKAQSETLELPHTGKGKLSV